MKLILAADENWAIGNSGGLLCHLPSDLKYFKSVTSGKTVVMGRKTLESLPGGRPLPNRRNIVISSTLGEVEGADVVKSLEEFDELINREDIKQEEIFVIGGGQIYKALLPQCDTCYITKLQDKFEADTFFVNLDEREDFILAEESEIHEENGVGFTFCRYERV